MKKIISIILAIVMTMGVFSVYAFATDTPVVTVKSDVASAKVGDVVTVTVDLAKDSKLCALGFDIKYDENYFEVATFNENGFTNGTKLFEGFTLEYVNAFNKGIVKYAATTVNPVTDAAAPLMQVKFKVLKTGGSFELDVTEAYTSENQKDQTDVTAEYARACNTTITIACAHANKTEEVVKNATCTEAGTKAVKCADCGKELSTETIPATGHKFSEDAVIKAPTCTEEGLAKGVCENCGEEKESAIPATGHSFGEWVVVEEATTEKEGLAERTCACGEKETKVLEKLDAPKVWGDVNGDGKLSAMDARWILQSSTQIRILTDDQMKVADVNGDDKVSAMDARWILQAMVGKRPIPEI